MHDTPDEELMSRAARGDEQAFVLIVRRYKDELTNFAERFMGDRDDAEDVVQEAFVRVWRNRESFDAGGRFSTWLYTIASNLAKTRLHRRALWKFVRLGSGDGAPADIPDAATASDAHADEAIRDEHIQRALGRLPPKFRELVVLRDIQQLSYEEITAITGLAMGTVKSRINRGRALLREELRDLIRE